LLIDVARRNCCSVSQVALSWLLNKPGVLPIPRTNDIGHLRENMESAEVRLPAEDLDELDGLGTVDGESRQFG